MKKALLISGVIAILLLSLLLAGWADTDDAVKRALRQGGRLYSASEYAPALESYEAGLIANPDNKDLNFNAAQSAYKIGDYEKAAGYYDKSDDCAEKFLNLGNIYFKAGEAAADQNQMAQFYTQAVQTYREGITKFPQDVPLKYNYELAKEKLEELLENMQQESGNDDQNNEESENGDQNEGENESESEGGDRSEEENENKGGNQSEGGDSREDQEQGGQTQGESGEEQEKEQESETAGESGENPDGADAAEEESGTQKQGESGAEEDGGAQKQDGNSDDGEGQQGAYNQDEAGIGQDMQTIERILEMLESEEKDSLKNNQEVVVTDEGKEGHNGW